jgi:hypothetical protein
MIVYPGLHLLSDGRIFHSGPDETTENFDVQAETWQFVDDTGFGVRGTPKGDFGSVMLPPGHERILIFGGRNPSTQEGTETAEIIDFADPVPAWSWASPMHFRRDHPDSVILPDGKVLVIGGGFDHDTPTYPSELFDPDTETWTVAATMKSQLRGYHSSALLLPDGRVISAGGNDPCPCPKTAEFYSPGYLFRGPRPVITSAPASVQYGQTFDVFTPDESVIDTVVFIRPGASTHSRNMSQRYVALAFTPGTGRLEATAPSNGNAAPPGYYLLFIVDNDGVPSEAVFVLVE